LELDNCREVVNGHLPYAELVLRGGRRNHEGSPAPSCASRLQDYALRVTGGCNEML
jgi:hypothetical protein